MATNGNPLTDHLDLWTSALLNKSTAGRGSNGKQEAYGIKKLRELILELAVRGKLVPQDPNDEPASMLLGKIVAEKQRLLQEGTIRTEKPLPAISDGEIPEHLPKGWAIARLADVLNVINGRAYKKDEMLQEGTPLLRVGNLFTSNEWYYSDLELEPEKYIDNGDLIYAWSASFGPFIWQGGRVIYHYHIWKLDPYDQKKVNKGYLRLYLEATTEKIKACGSGIAMIHMTKEKMERLVLPVPPLAEQYRIVAKVDQLMALCDQLEQQQTHSLEAHQTLVETLLGTLTQSPVRAEPVEARASTVHPSTSSGRTELEDAWARIAGHFDTLFTTEHSIDQLKQTILQLAVMGRLVPQDPNDEPAESAVLRVRNQSRPARYDKRSRARIEGVAALSVGPAERKMPQGWMCVPLIDIARLESGHTPSRSRADWWGGDVPWVGVVDARLHDGQTIYETRQHTNQAGLENSAARLLPTGTACVSRTASVGYVVILGKPMATSQDFVNWVPSDAVASDWLRLVFVSEKEGFDRFGKGAVHQTIYYPEWLSMYTVLPPLAEQHRIVAKVDELMGLCDALKARIKNAQTTQIHLADAIVEQAVA